MNFEKFIDAILYAYKSERPFLVQESFIELPNKKRAKNKPFVMEEAKNSKYKFFFSYNEARVYERYNKVDADNYVCTIVDVKEYLNNIDSSALNRVDKKFIQKEMAKQHDVAKFNILL